MSKVPPQALPSEDGGAYFFADLYRLYRSDFCCKALIALR